MKNRRILVCPAIVLILTALLAIGCESKQLVGCRQEKLQLQKTIEAKQTEIENLNRGQEKLIQLLLQSSRDLTNCQNQLEELIKEESGKTQKNLPSAKPQPQPGESRVNQND